MASATTVRALAVALAALAGAAFARDSGIVIVFPLLVLSGYAAAVGALDVTGISGRVARSAVLTAHLLRAAIALGLYLVSYYHWPLGRSLQVGDGFWTFCMDALNYHVWAPHVLAALDWQTPPPDPGAALDYYLIVALIYGAFGLSPLTAIAINVTAWTLATVLLIALVQWLRRAPIPPVLSALIALWPSGLIWPSQLMKDSIVVMLLVAGAAAAARLIAEQRLRSIALWATALWLILMPLLRLRVYVGRLLLAAALVTIAIAIVRLHKRDSSWWPIATAMVVALLASVGTWRISVTDSFAMLTPSDPARALVRYAESREAQRDLAGARFAYERARLYQPESTTILTALARLAPPSPTELNWPVVPINYRVATPSYGIAGRVAGAMWGGMVDGVTSHAVVPAARDALSALSPMQLGAAREKFEATGGASVESGGVRILGWRDVIRLSPIIGATALFAPFPWDVLRPRGITGAFRTFAVIEPLLMLALFPAVVLASIRLRRPEAWFVALFAASGAFAVAYAIPNVGTLVRLRAGFTLLLVGVAALGWEDYRGLFLRLVPTTLTSRSRSRRDRS